MKKIISSVIAAILVLFQAFLPLNDGSIGIWQRIIVASIFLLFWIIYIVFSDKIEYFISKIIFHKDLEYKNPKQKYDDFYSKIIPFCSTLNDNVAVIPIEEFQKHSIYNMWCYVINFILTDCCKSCYTIDNTIVCTNNEAFVADFRSYKIDPNYIQSIIKLLNQFLIFKVDIINEYQDADQQIKHLVEINKIFAVNDKKFQDCIENNK